MFLLVVVVENGGAILGSSIAELPIWCHRVNVPPKHFKKLSVGDLRRIKDNLHDFCMPGLASRDLLISGVGCLPPVYPEVVEMTPLSSSNGGSMHQKQPPAKVAFARLLASADCGVFPVSACARAKRLNTKIISTIRLRLFIIHVLSICRRRLRHKSLDNPPDTRSRASQARIEHIT